MLSLIIGASIATLMTLWDNATDYGLADAETTWFLGPVHVPTLLVDGGAVLIAILGWALGNPSRPLVSSGTVEMMLWSLPIALGIAYAIATFFLPIYNKVKETLNLLPDWLVGDAVKKMQDG